MGIFDESYSSMELARILGVHRVTITNWIKQGALRAVRTPGGRYKVAKRDLIAFLEQREIPVPAYIRTGKKRLVVAVDDEKPVLKTLETFFSRGDLPFLYEFKAFENPFDAALYIGDSKPDLVLLDLVMPQLDGFELAKKIKGTSPKTRIIVITGHPTEENLAHFRSYGVDAFLGKPLELTVLKGTMEEILMA
ncbi:MAG: response regulator [Thermodesulfobacteriota bacterium]|nr:response regulator [Thermodesulfobacteriota bacterium]